MSGAFSGHLLDAYNPNSPFNSSIRSHGAMSFNPGMHGGTPFAQQSFSLFGSQSPFCNDSISEETAKKIATLQVKLDRKLGPEFISQRPGPAGGPKLTYVEGWKVINLANEVFGFNGWSSSIVNLATDFVDFSEETKRYTIGVTAVVRVTLRDGVHHEDIGYGISENSKSKGAALDKCKKEAVTDGLKRALRNFGNMLGNCLYDKAYTAEVVKMKVEPPKFNKEELHRRPECEVFKPQVSTPSTAPSNQNQVHSKLAKPNVTAECSTPIRVPMQPKQTCKTVPSSLRNEIKNEPPISTPSAIGYKSTSGQAQKVTAPITPATTPLHHPQVQHQPQQEKRVTFAKPISPSLAAASVSSTSASDSRKTGFDFDSDDTFDLNDTELLALAEIEADIGRPIGEGDMGRPIDHNEGLATGIDGPEETRAAKETIVQQSVTGNSGSIHRSLSREEVIAAALQSRGKPNSTATSTEQKKVSVTPAPISAVVARSSIMQTNAPALFSDSSSLSHQLQQQDPKTTSYGRQRLQQYLKQKRQQRDGLESPEDQNQIFQQKNCQNVEGSGVVKGLPTSSTMGGGFNFPPGMNSFQSSTASTSVIGAKRPAEAMASNSGSGPLPMNFKGGRPGMDLQHVAPMNRQVLGALEIGQGGDVKRVRR